MRPTIGSPWIAGATAGSGASTTAGPPATSIVRVAARRCPRCPRPPRVRTIARPTSAACGTYRNWNGNVACPADQLTVGEQADLLEVAARVGGRDVDLDRVARGGDEPVGAGHLNATGVGAVVSAEVGSRCCIARATSALRVSVPTCSSPNPNVTVSAVERANPPACVCGVVTSSSIFSCRNGSWTEMPDQLRSRVGDLARGAATPLASWLGSLPEPLSTVIGPTPAKMLPATGSIGWPL